MLTDPPTSASDLVVEVRDGAVALGGRPVLRGIDLSVPSGEFVAVMGANGSGKSTLVRAMLGLHPLTRGEVRLFGTPLGDFHDWRRLGYVPQRPGATSGVPASVWEIVGSGRVVRRGILRRLGRRDRSVIEESLAAVGLADRAHDGIATLSGGQQQRVLIARALAGEPDAFFLDEPTAGVDLPNQQALAGALAHLAERGATVVLVAHELGPMTPLVQRVVVMRDGRIAYDGDPLTDAQVHQPGFGEHPAYPLAEGHTHHHDTPAHHDHAPHVASPLDPRNRR